LRLLPSAVRLFASSALSSPPLDLGATFFPPRGRGPEDDLLKEVEEISEERPFSEAAAAARRAFFLVGGLGYDEGE
jgi:hypothetical protein